MKNVKKAYVIVGLGFGDEGKGLVTDYFCAHIDTPIVIRFNGGQQAGHTVFLKSGKKHVFSNFGAGSLRGVPTFWSKNCTFCPGFFLEELDMVKSIPEFFIDKSCPVTTHYDILYNRLIEKFRGDKKYGSCGLGFGATIVRHNELYPNFTASNLTNKSTSIDQLKIIREYYKKKIQAETDFLFSSFDHEGEDKNFLNLAKRIKDLVTAKQFRIVDESYIFSKSSKWKNFIFEGAQGILLDEIFGNYPYITKSNTTSKNALEMIQRNCFSSSIDTDIVYVTRAYLTRHGEGPFRSFSTHMKLKNTMHESNVFNHFQGKFRKGRLDINLLNYSINCDQKYSRGLPKHLFITCLDQVNCSRIPIVIDNKLKTISYKTLPKILKYNFASVRYSFSRYSENLV